MTNKTNQLINEVLELDKNATPGPWTRDVSIPIRAENRALLHHYRTSAPKLAKALQVAIEALKNTASIRQPYREDETDFGITKESKEATEALAEIEKIIGE